MGQTSRDPGIALIGLERLSWQKEDSRIKQLATILFTLAAVCFANLNLLGQSEQYPGHVTYGPAKQLL